MLLKNSCHTVVIVLVGTMRCDRLKAWRYHSAIWHILRTGNCLELLVITDKHAAISHVITVNSGLCFLFTWNFLKLTRNGWQASSPAQLFPFTITEIYSWIFEAIFRNNALNRDRKKHADENEISGFLSIVTTFQLT